MRRTKRILAGVALSAALVMSPMVSLPASAAPAARFQIVDFSFSPAQRTITVGQKVGWVNQGFADHTATSDTPGLFGSPILAPGGRFQASFPTAGTFTFHCRIHPFMTGTVVVNP